MCGWRVMCRRIAECVRNPPPSCSNAPQPSDDMQPDASRSWLTWLRHIFTNRDTADNNGDDAEANPTPLDTIPHTGGEDDDDDEDDDSHSHGSIPAEHILVTAGSHHGPHVVNTDRGSVGPNGDGSQPVYQIPSSSTVSQNDGASTEIKTPHTRVINPVTKPPRSQESAKPPSVPARNTTPLDHPRVNDGYRTPQRNVPVSTTKLDMNESTSEQETPAHSTRSHTAK
jgi:hypothetical protein